MSNRTVEEDALDEPLEWHVFYSQSADREYYYEPNRRIATWTMPDSFRQRQDTTREGADERAFQNEAQKKLWPPKSTRRVSFHQDIGGDDAQGTQHRDALVEEVERSYPAAKHPGGGLGQSQDRSLPSDSGASLVELPHTSLSRRNAVIAAASAACLGAVFVVSPMFFGPLNMSSKSIEETLGFSGSRDGRTVDVTSPRKLESDVVETQVEKSTQSGGLRRKESESAPDALSLDKKQQSMGERRVAVDSFAQRSSMGVGRKLISGDAAQKSKEESGGWILGMPFTKAGHHWDLESNRERNHADEVVASLSKTRATIAAAERSLDAESEDRRALSQSAATDTERKASKAMEARLLQRAVEEAQMLLASQRVKAAFKTMEDEKAEYSLEMQEDERRRKKRCLVPFAYLFSSDCRRQAIENPAFNLRHVIDSMME